MSEFDEPLDGTRDQVLSTLSDDPDMVELVQLFVGEMCQRVEMIGQAVAENDLGRLRTIAHQLKGAATGYGFAPISAAAATLEREIDLAGPATQTTAMNAQIEELIDLCRRAAA